MGMFSTLNYLIDAPLEEILEQIPLCAEAKEGLLHHTGRCGMLYDLHCPTSEPTGQELTNSRRGWVSRPTC